MNTEQPAKSVLHTEGFDAPVDKQPELVRQTSGPFRGRIYQRTASGLKRRRDLEAKEARELRAKQLEELQRQIVRGGRRGGKRSARYEEIVDEVTRHPRASDFEPHPPGVTWPNEEATVDECAAEAPQAVPVSVASEDQAG